MAGARVTGILSGLPEARAGLARLYQDLHRHPELSFREARTAGVVSSALVRLGFDVTGQVGRTGVVGVLENGEGPRVLLRADFDALPVAERTDLPYASTTVGADSDGRAVPVMHACGHDMHATCLLGALELLANERTEWTGTLVAVFQPAEEIGRGAQAMVDDGLFDRFGVPDVVLAQHLAPYPAGTVGCRPGPTLAATDAFRVRMYGRGGHTARPESGIDPVVMAASTVVRLQSVVSREVSGVDTAVVSVGSIHSGSKENVIPDEAELRLDVRTYTDEVRGRVLAAVGRIVRAEAVASGARREPDIVPISTFPVLVNDPMATDRTVTAFRDHFGDARIFDPGPVTTSEDCGILGSASGAPVCYWFLGGTDARAYQTALDAGTVAEDVPTNHSPLFAPVIQPTLDTGVEALAVAALGWLPEPEPAPAS